MTYLKIIERPYKVYVGTQNYVSEYCSDKTVPAGIEWRYDKSFDLESDAEAYANRVAEEHEFVKIEKKEA